MTITSSDEVGHAQEKDGDLSRRVAVGEPILLFLIAIAARLPFLDHIPVKDEYNHVLAARALLERGTLEILPGADPYDRAWAFTYLIAGVFRWFGESLVVGRIPAVVAAAILIVLLFAWVRSEAGRVAAWMAALLLVFSPVSLWLSQWVRFYTIHALLFLVACLALYRLVGPAPMSRKQRGLLVLLAGLALLVCLHLQLTTVVGILGIAAWLAVAWALPTWWRLPGRRARVMAAAGVLALLGIVAAALWWTGTAHSLLARGTTVAGWAEGRTDNVRYYHFIFLEQYPTLWTLAPLAFLLAMAYRPRAALLCGCVFGVAFVGHSFLAWKSERYLFYALPMFFALWGLAIGAVLPWLRNRVERAVEHLFPLLGSARLRSGVAATLLVAAVLFVAFGSAATSYTVKYLTVGDAEWRGWGGYRGNPDWVAASAFLHREIERSEVVLGSYDVTALYAVGRIDYFLRHLDAASGGFLNFMPRGKTPAPIVATPDALRLVMDCHASGTALIESVHWRSRWATSDDVADYLEANATRIELPRAWRMHAFHWERGEADVDVAACAEIRERRQAWAESLGGGRGS